MRSADAYFEGQSGRQANAARFQVGRTPAHHLRVRYCVLNRARTWTQPCSW